MLRLPPRATRTDTLFPYTTLFRSPYPARTTPVAQGNALDGYFEWKGYLPLASHIQATNPSKGYMANWNNSGAPGWWAADSNGTYGPTHRVAMLQQRLAAFKASEIGRASCRERVCQYV